VSACLGEVRDPTIFDGLSGRIHSICDLFFRETSEKRIQTDGTRCVFVTETFQISLGQARELFGDRFDLPETKKNKNDLEKKK